MTAPATAPLPGAAPAVDSRPAEPPDGTLHLGTGPRIDPGVPVDPSRVRPLLPQALKPKKPLRRKDDDEADPQVGDSGNADADLTR